MSYEPSYEPSYVYTEQRERGRENRVNEEQSRYGEISRADQFRGEAHHQTPGEHRQHHGDEEYHNREGRRSDRYGGDVVRDEEQTHRSDYSGSPYNKSYYREEDRGSGSYGHSRNQEVDDNRYGRREEGGNYRNNNQREPDEDPYNDRASNAKGYREEEARHDQPRREGPFDSTSNRRDESSYGGDHRDGRTNTDNSYERSSGQYERSDHGPYRHPDSTEDETYSRTDNRNNHPGRNDDDYTDSPHHNAGHGGSGVRRTEYGGPTEYGSSTYGSKRNEQNSPDERHNTDERKSGAHISHPPTSSQNSGVHYGNDAAHAGADAARATADYVDKGIEMVAEKMGFHLNDSQADKLGQFARMEFEKLTGHEFPLKDPKQHH